MSRADFFDATRAPEARATPHDLVEAFQRDLLRLAFALTGDRAVSVFLARDVLLDILANPEPDEEIDPNSWSRLVRALGRRYMLGADPETSADEPANAEAKRLREAVELLSRPMRTALVLRDLGGLNERDVADLTGIDPDELNDVLDWSRERLRDAVGRLSGEPPQRLLASMAVDAPQRDLWPELAPVVEGRERARRRQSRRIVAATLSGFLFFALGAVAWFLGDVPFVGGASEATATPTAVDVITIISSPTPTQPPLPTPTPAPTRTAVEWIGSTLGNNALLRGYLLDEDFSGTGERVWFSFEPDNSEPVSQIPSAAHEVRHISPDGRWLALVEWKHDGTVRNNGANAPPQMPSIAVTHDGVQQDWEYAIPHGSFPNSWDTAILGERLYIINSTPEPATLTALDLATGEIVLTRTLEVPRLGAELRAGWIPVPEGDWNVDVGFYVAPEAADPALYAYVTLNQFGNDVRNRWTRWLYKIDPADLRHSFLNSESVIAISESGENDTAAPDFPIWGARVLPDNSGLYALGQVNQQQTIEFLDFEGGTVETLTTSFSTVASADLDYFTTVISNDGRRLYVYSNLSGEFAIIDLVGRRIQRTFPLDLGDLRDRLIRAQGAHLSHDGQYLYLIENISEIRRATTFSHPVWVIDLTTWTVLQGFGIPGSDPWLISDPDGARIHAISRIGDPGARIARWRSVLVSLDAETYKEVERIDFSELLDQNVSFDIVSLVNLYRQSYGHTPDVDGIEPADVDEYTTLPRARIVVEDENVPVGVTRPVELEFLDPATGETLTRSDPRVRFDPEQPVTLVFEQPGAKSVISVSAELGPGQRRGTFKLKPDGDGYWNARIVVGDEDDGFTLLLRDVFWGAPTFEADDGRAYAVRIETEPDEPIPAGELLFRVRFIDAATSEPLPESVSLVGGLPDTMRVTLIGFGALNRNLEAAGHGVYETTLELQGPAEWSASLVFQQPEADEAGSTRIEIDAIEVVDSSARQDATR